MQACICIFYAFGFMVLSIPIYKLYHYLKEKANEAKPSSSPACFYTGFIDEDSCITYDSFFLRGCESREAG